MRSFRIIDLICWLSVIASVCTVSQTCDAAETLPLADTRVPDTHKSEQVNSLYYQIASAFW